MTTADLPIRKRVHGDRNRYMVFVLWLHGSTQTAIASVVGLRKKQVSGIVDRSEYRNRAALTLEQRDAFLAELESIRGHGTDMIDGGALPKSVFRARRQE